MKKIIDRPQLLFVGFALIVLISGYLNNKSSILINIDATYVMLDVWSASIYSSIFFVLVAINYATLTLAQKQAKPVLTILHIILQMVSLLPFLYFFYTADARRDYDQTIWMNTVLVVSFLVFLTGTLLHFINFLISIFKKKESARFP